MFLSNNATCSITIEDPADIKSLTASAVKTIELNERQASVSMPIQLLLFCANCMVGLRRLLPAQRRLQPSHWLHGGIRDGRAGALSFRCSMTYALDFATPWHRKLQEENAYNSVVKVASIGFHI